VTDLACPKQQQCPGCPLGNAPYETGLARKGQRLVGALQRHATLAPHCLPPRPAAPTHAYRLRAKLVSDGRALGLYERGTHRVIDVEGCPVLSPALTAATAALRRRLPLPIYGADLRETSEGVLLTLLSDAPADEVLFNQLAADLVERGEALSVALSVRSPGSVRLLAGEPRVLAGATTARHALAPGSPYAYAAHGGFVQAHAGQASYVYGEISRRIGALAHGGRAPRVLELFAGNGALALALAESGVDVTAVEAYAPAIVLSERAAREQALSLTAVASDASRYIRQISPAAFDAILVNPPRRGLERSLREALARAKPKLLGYVSCNPQTLARDAAHLALAGLGLQSAEPLDMIPWSDAVEALCWLSPRPSPPPRVLYADERCLAVDKEPYERVAAAHGPSLTARVRALPDCADAVAADAWGGDVSGVCWFARRADDLPLLRAGLASGERRLTVLVRGNLRKQGTVTRERHGQRAPGARYKRSRAVGRHTLADVATRDLDETDVLRDFASIGHPVLGDARHGDHATNQFAEHRLGLDRSFVHCRESTIAFNGAEPLLVSADLAPDLLQVVADASSD
jgi:23S rRNA (uracil1939-C5)-methyltransferase